MLKNEKGMALIPLIITLFVLLAIAGATIFMIGDGFLYNKDVKSTVQKEENNTVKYNNTTNNNNKNIENNISSERK